MTSLVWLPECMCRVFTRVCRVVWLVASAMCCRREAAPQLDFRLSHLQGFSESEVKPLLQRLEMTSLVKAIPHLQQLLGGPAPPSDLTAAVPAALAAFEASKSEAAVPVEQQSSAADPQQGDTTSTSNGSDVPAAVAATPEVPCVQRARSETGPVSLLPASLQARLPAMRIVHSNGQLQQLLSQLQQHKVGEGVHILRRC